MIQGRTSGLSREPPNNGGARGYLFPNRFAGLHDYGHLRVQLFEVIIHGAAIELSLGQGPESVTNVKGLSLSLPTK